MELPIDIISSKVSFIAEIQGVLKLGNNFLLSTIKLFDQFRSNLADSVGTVHDTKLC